MDINYIAKLYNDKIYLGTVFFVSQNIAYSALHNLKSLNTDYEKCYILLNEKKYSIKEVMTIESLDFVQIIVNENINQSIYKPIITDCIARREKLHCKGYRGTFSKPKYVCLDLDEYPGELDLDEASDFCMIIKGEEDGVKWNGISGSPIYNEDGIKGIVLRNIGEDGIKTRLKILSFNKIINYIVNNNREDILKYFPENNMKSQLKSRILENKNKCDRLYNICRVEYECNNVNMMTNYLKINEGISLENIINEINNILNTYALSLDERYQTENIASMESINKIIQRVSNITSYMKEDYNSIYILLWQMTEGIMECPRIGRVIIDDDGRFIECDVYLKKLDNGEISLLLPIAVAYEELYLTISKIIDNIEIKGQAGYLDFNEIELDNTTLDCLDKRTSVKIHNLINRESTAHTNFQITALGLYNSNMYENIPPILNTNEKIKKHFKKIFNEEFNYNSDLYNSILERLQKNNHININLFILPVKEIEKIKNI